MMISLITTDEYRSVHHLNALSTSASWRFKLCLKKTSTHHFTRLRQPIVSVIRLKKRGEPKPAYNTDQVGGFPLFFNLLPPKLATLVLHENSGLYIAIIIVSLFRRVWAGFQGCHRFVAIRVITIRIAEYKLRGFKSPDKLN